MLSVFGDESADESKQRIFAVAGIVGTEDLWENLESLWVERTNGIPFHANNCDSDKGDYRDNPHSENKALYRDLAIMLANSGLCGYGLAVDLAAQREVFPHAPDIAFYKGFTMVLATLADFARVLNEKIKFSFDSREESEHNTGMLYGMYRNKDENKGHLFPEISFLCSRDHPRIQIADLMARETMKDADNHFGPVRRPRRKSLLALVETQMFHVESISIDWFRGLRSEMPRLQEITGVTEESYRAWLGEHKLEHNLTNLFRFGDYNKKVEVG
jgi:Protein of unknown function (DUF3800)